MRIRVYLAERYGKIANLADFVRKGQLPTTRPFAPCTRGGTR